jgi:hypothetical protein
MRWLPSTPLMLMTTLVALLPYFGSTHMDDWESLPDLSKDDELKAVNYNIHFKWHSAALRPTSAMPNITLVSHATIDRLAHVVRWCRQWRGPMSISVFARPMVDDADAIMGAFAVDPCLAAHADLHLVTHPDHRYNPRATKYEEGVLEMIAHYPFNVQRNVAIDGCVGDLALLMDIDFHLMPVPTNHDEHLGDDVGGSEQQMRVHFERQRRHVASWSFLQSEPHVLHTAFYVIPAVETVVKSMPLPTTIEELSLVVQSHGACPFYGHHCKHCHRPTNLNRFLKPPPTSRVASRSSDRTSSKSVDNDETADVPPPYLVDYEHGYEPYGIVNKSGTVPLCIASPTNTFQTRELAFPRYRNEFVGRGKDKVSFFYEFSAGQKRAFIVLAPPFFIVHAGRGDHPSAPGEEYLVRVLQNNIRYREFRQEIERIYDPLWEQARPAHQCDRSFQLSPLPAKDEL